MTFAAFKHDYIAARPEPVTHHIYGRGWRMLRNGLFSFVRFETPRAKHFEVLAVGECALQEGWR